jgi:hypothetical protein
MRGARFRKALCAAPPFVGEQSIPFNSIWSFEQRIDVLCLTGDWIVHLAGNSGIVLHKLHSLDKKVTSMSARIEVEGRESMPWADAANGSDGRLGHPRKCSREEHFR